MMEGRSVPEVADALGINRSALSRVIKGRVTISADIACRLLRGFGLYTETWLEMQAEFDAFGPGQRVAREGRLYGVVLFGGSCVGRQGAQYVTHGLLSWPCGNAVWGGGKAVAHEEGVCVVLWRHGAAKLALSGVPDQI